MLVVIICIGFNAFLEKALAWRCCLYDFCIGFKVWWRFLLLYALVLTLLGKKFCLGAAAFYDFCMGFKVWWCFLLLYAWVLSTFFNSCCSMHGFGECFFESVVVCMGFKNAPYEIHAYSSKYFQKLLKPICTTDKTYL